MQDLLRELQEPFPADQVEWRVVRSGVTDGEPWLRVVPYLQARTIQERLDDVVGPAGWQVRFRDGPGAHLICGIGILVEALDGPEWLWKEDGTGQMQSRDGFSPADAGKGDFSMAFKRAASSGWGIGRYVAHVPDDWAELDTDGRYRSKVTQRGQPDRWVRWNPPALPSWALPGGSGRPDGTPRHDPATGEELPPAEEVAVEALEDEVRRLRNKALRADLLDDRQAARVDEALASGDEETLVRTGSWLEERLSSSGSQQ